MRIYYGARRIDWTAIVGFTLVAGATAAMLALMGRPF